MEIDWISRADKLAFSVSNFINGRRSDGHGERLTKYAPRDGRLLCEFAASDPREVDDAVRQARRAFNDGRWSKRSAQHRKETLLKFAALVEQHREEFGLLECLDVGKPISDALNFDVPAAVAAIKYNAEAVDKFSGRVYAADDSSLSYQLHRPVGVIAGVVGWNFPLVLAASKIAPVLAMGNCLVLKPSELTSLSTVRLAELAVEAGVPEGVFNVIHGGPAVGAALAFHGGVDLLTFTGSSQTGKRLLAASGSNMKRLILECGGKAPNIVFDDARNLDAVADAIVARAFWNQGQVCTASSRLLIQDGILQVLLPLVIRKTAALNLGDPLSTVTKLGPLVSQGHRQKVFDYVDVGLREGGEIAYRPDSASPHESGFYVHPVIFKNVSPEMRIAKEEIFGPVLSVVAFGNEEEAISIANGTAYGLSAIVWTRDLGRAHRVSQGIRAGWITINATDRPTGGPAEGVLPVGGEKESGIGTEGGIEGLLAYTSSSSVQIFV